MSSVVKCNPMSRSLFTDPKGTVPIVCDGNGVSVLKKHSVDCTAWQGLNVSHLHLSPSL